CIRDRDKAQSVATSTGEKIDSSMNKVGNFMDDSAITAKVKAALVDDKNIKSTDISVKTERSVVTLSGFVESQTQAEQAVSVAKGVEGVTSVSDKLHVRDSKNGSMKGYAG
ncbi:molecular chaperone OsmY, partial [Enterobacter sp. 63]